MAPNAALMGRDDMVLTGSTDLALITALERHSAAAWPASEVTTIDGWELRMAPASRSRRVNCLTPVSTECGPFPPVFALARTLCADKARPCTIRLQPLAGPEPARILQELGQSPEGTTSVQLAPLVGHHQRVPDGVELAWGVDERWVDAMGIVHGDDAQERAAVQSMVASANGQQAFATVRDKDKPVAFGRVVVRQGLAGIFHIVTAEDSRRRGYARRIMDALMAAAQHRGAKQAYLQVTVANTAARPLYASLGFREIYTYDYWSG